MGGSGGFLNRGWIRKPAARALLWLGLVVGVCYASSLNGSFHFDDSHSLVSNASVHHLSSIPSFWTDPTTSSFIPENRVYRPLTYTLYSICWFAGGGAPWPFHLLKLIFHWWVCVVFYLLWRRLWSIPDWFPVELLKRGFSPDWAAFSLALIFAVHPACTECLNYISATTSLQCAAFYLWAYYCYWLYRDTGKRRFWIGMLFLYFCSVATKEEGITLPAVLLATEIFLRDGTLRGRLAAGLSQVRGALIFGFVLALWIFNNASH